MGRDSEESIFVGGVSIIISIQKSVE